MASVDIWMPIYVGDYLKKTMSLDAEGHGIYHLLMYECWNHGGFRSGIHRIKVIARSGNEELIKEILSDYFKLSNGRWTNSRVSEEKLKAAVRSEKARAKANVRWHNTGNATALLQECSSSSSSSSKSKTHTTSKTEEKKRTRKRFQKPTMEELKEYSVSISFQDFDSEKFLDYYESNGWKVGKNPMVDWKATVRGWKKNGHSKQSGSKAAYKHGGEINFEL